MTKRLLVLAGVLAAVRLAAQGTVNFQNSPSSLVRFQAPDNRPVPPGSFRVALLYQYPDGVFMQLGDSVVIGPVPGIFVGGTRTTPVVTEPGSEAVFELQVWSAPYDTFEEARMVSGAFADETDPFRNPTGDPTANPPIPPAALTGFRGLIIYVSEPSPFWLALLPALVPAWSKVCRARAGAGEPSS